MTWGEVAIAMMLACILNDMNVGTPRGAIDLIV
jgi:hypothetical protein